MNPARPPTTRDDPIADLIERRAALLDELSELKPNESNDRKIRDRNAELAAAERSLARRRTISPQP